MEKNKKGLVAIILGIVAIVGSLTAIIVVQSKGTYAAGMYTITFLGAEGYELCDGLTCTTGPDGTVANCTGSYGGICNSWSTTPCRIDGSTGNCAKPGGQGLAINSVDIATHTFDSNVTYYCLAGSSFANKVCDGPRPSKSTPSEPSKTSKSTGITPAGSSTPSSSEPVNPPTGVTAIYVVWAIGLGALIYAVIYFKKVMSK